MAKKRKPLPEHPVEVEIESLTHDGRGLAHVDGKALFVDGALPGERVQARYTRIQRHYDEAAVVSVEQPSSDRVTPRCPHFGVCGGCRYQHLAAEAQVRVKQEILQDVLTRIGKVTPETWLAPLSAAAWGYRRKARLGVRYVPKKGRVLVGFRERRSSFVTDLTRCDILHPAVGERIPAIAAALQDLSIRTRLPQIEVAIGDGPAVLVFRVLDPPTAEDLARLAALGQETGLHIYVQEGGIETIRPLPGQEVALHYSLPRHQVQIAFEPSDFTQVNLELNRAMVDQALGLLDVQPDERVLDLFCGLGNFTLPLARQAEEVLGLEGDAGLVARARANAERHHLASARFEVADLYGEGVLSPWLQGRFDKALLDPPRSGALAVLDWLPRLGVQRLVYVSCYPATLARDADQLVNGLGYRLISAGAMDMFPHTEHLEAMALFERDEER
ncbi:SAM-dependent methyltransferase, tRNA(uracil-5)-methyltransferase [Thioflavicoccus mobilis 8321]|uniref:23S rRNA (uracil(1939)-C(5))-methyltransferase RlmD n=1 Tax=Thioflavicoccus mobilis 8321 TaxID=765912 RepID=L0GYK3_9GAMM|nr:23S rRNA (uracil(1939)-C(5))-methyltransferase RlmD [Thioflavicoccus mobilis]AGA90394.1 SAM-dependent methyltransferase, tRNA(uracil-5)-methyltransferase [Thioflavicoccus mobilis 8321]